jgi:rhodanese-related sulfurtransferase
MSGSEEARPELLVGQTMAQIEACYPAARRALFRAYHIGGCSACAYRPEETLAEVCARQEEPVDAELAARVILQAQEEEERLQVAPLELKRRLDAGEAIRLVDIRSREEHEAVKIPGSELLTQELTQELLHGSGGPWAGPVVFIDHAGRHVMDAVSYFIGHGLTTARGLKGGIDGWALEVDPEMPRYRLE